MPKTDFTAFRAQFREHELDRFINKVREAYKAIFHREKVSIELINDMDDREGTPTVGLEVDHIFLLYKNPVTKKSALGEEVVDGWALDVIVSIPGTYWEPPSMDYEELGTAASDREAIEMLMKAAFQDALSIYKDHQAVEEEEEFYSKKNT